ncbi:MAG: exodeoxyribonuclease VII small subunit [Succinivibrio sp.]
MGTKTMTSIEERLKNLEELTSKLEGGSLPIDEAIALYSQGMELAVSCRKSLEELSMKIEVARQKATASLDEEKNESDGDDGELPF